MYTINRSVGNKGFNETRDISVVQRLINKNIRHLTPLMLLKVDGDCGPITIGIIVEFQRRIMNYARPDGRVDPKKATINKLNELLKEDNAKENQSSLFDTLLLQVQRWISTHLEGFNAERSLNKSKTLVEADYRKAANEIGVGVAVVKAVASVESTGGGFLSNSDPKILFEGHWFSKLTGGKYDKSKPSISYSAWTKKHYKGKAEEYTRYNAAKRLDKTAAMKSTSWGKFQIMGFNYNRCGYSNVEDFVKDMYKSESFHLLAFVRLIKSNKWDIYLKSKNWSEFAKRYNGPRYTENKHDIQLKQAYNAYSAGEK